MAKHQHSMTVKRMQKYWEKRLAQETQTLKELRVAKEKAGPEALESIKGQIAYHAGEKVAAQNALEQIKNIT
jgi:hypothetical protein